MRTFLVRHGESEGNVDREIYKTKPDHAINLTVDGGTQAEMAGRFIKNMKNPPFEPRVWVSPYARTRQTADGLLAGGLTPESVREHIAIVEQQFGLFDGVSDEDLPILFPNEYGHYKKSEDFGGRFWARMPLGESRYDVALRVHQAFGTFKRDAAKHGIDDLVIVTHGVVIRAFVMMWCHKSWEWFEAEPNPKNCSIRLIEGSEDHGYIYTGETPPIESRTETI
jgi:broad specificity phosphatase PhoE